MYQTFTTATGKKVFPRLHAFPQGTEGNHATSEKPFSQALYLNRYSSNRHPNCDFAASLGILVPHERQCQYRLVQCPDDGCGQRVPLEGFLSHWRKKERRALSIRDVAEGVPFEHTFSMRNPSHRLSQGLDSIEFQQGFQQRTFHSVVLNALLKITLNSPLKFN